MALQIYANPNLAAQLQFEGARALAQGISSAGASVGDGLGSYLTRRRKDRDELEQLREAASYLAKDDPRAPEAADIAHPNDYSVGYDQAIRSPDGMAQYAPVPQGDVPWDSPYPAIQSVGSGTPAPGPDEPHPVDQFHDKAAKVAKASRTLLEEGFGYTKSQSPHMGLNQLKGALQGENMRAAIAERALKAREAESHMRASDAMAAYHEEQTRNMAAAPAFYRELSQYYPSDTPITVDNDPVNWNGPRYQLPDGQKVPGIAEYNKAAAASGYNPPASTMNGMGVQARHEDNLDLNNRRLKEKTDYDKLKGIRSEARAGNDTRKLNLAEARFQRGVFEKNREYLLRAQNSQTAVNSLEERKRHYAWMRSTQSENMTPDQRRAFDAQAKLIVENSIRDPKAASDAMQKLVSDMYKSSTAQAQVNHVKAMAEVAARAKDLPFELEPDPNDAEGDADSDETPMDDGSSGAGSGGGGGGRFLFQGPGMPLKPIK